MTRKQEIKNLKSCVTEQQNNSVRTKNHRLMSLITSY